ncbi:peroxiredoxin [Kitasatospora sp. P5_F3]
MEIKVGQQAPEFTLNSHQGERITLSSFRGEKSVLLVFFPFAFSGVCTGELCSVRDDLSRFENEDVQVLAISTDPVFSLIAWAEKEGYKFPLLSDFWPHGATAQAYGVFEENFGIATRGTFLIDREGVVRFAEVNGPSEARDQTGWLKAIEEL